MQKEGLRFATENAELAERSYYLFSYSLVSMNWDPFLLWLVFNAHNEANHDWSGVSVGHPSRPQKLFNDLAYMVAARKVDDDDLDIWYMMGEGTAQRLNDSKHLGDRYGNRGKFPGEWGSQGFENMIQAGDDNWHP